MKIKLIINPVAGRKSAKRSIPIIKKIFSELSTDFNMEITRYPTQAIDLSKEASKANFDIIVAAGGDGTVNEVVNGMIESRSVLGVIPLGLGNDFAKLIGMPTNLKEACLAIYNGEVKNIDLGRVNNRYFVNCLGIGFDACVASESRRIGCFIPRKCIYLCSVIKMLFKYKSIPVNIMCADVKLDKEIILIAVGNGKTSGGGFLLTPEAKIDDGLIDVCIIDRVGKLNLFRNLPKVLKGTHRGLPHVSMLKTKKLIVDSSVSLLAHTDGEIIENNHYQIEVLSKRLRIVTP